jgi:hypothetical protein
MSTTVFPVTAAGLVLGTGFVSEVWGAVALAKSAVTLATKADAAGLELVDELAAGLELVDELAAGLELVVELAAGLELIDELAEDPPALFLLELQDVRSSPTTPSAATAVTRRLVGAALTKRVMFRNLLGPEGERSPMDDAPGPRTKDRRNF